MGPANWFLSQERETITIFGLSIGVPTALMMVIVFEWWHSFPFAFLFSCPSWRA